MNRYHFYLLVFSLLVLAGCGGPQGQGGPNPPDGGPPSTREPGGQPPDNQPPDDQPTDSGAAPAATQALVSSTDGETISGYIYADNTFQLWVNGELNAEDPIEFTPHNVVEVSFAADYPVTLAIRALDFADPNTGLEYDNTKIGDGGLIAIFSDGTVTSSQWQCKVVFSGPTDRNCLNNDPANTCQVTYDDEPDGWQDPDFDDSDWPSASVFSASTVRPQADYDNYDWGAAEFIWGPDLELDNTILCRYTIGG